MLTMKKGGVTLGQSNLFHPGSKAPNNGVYVEVGENGDPVVNPKSAHLHRGDRFPETTNDARHWRRKRKP
ncbi:hypothetical protein B4096_0320 [Heyndrickxia coagulans]|jgi:hypothetical protein|uniref:YjzC family protein n=1 Tax=Heyndrickxia coagulans TaxID=1398 RepID=A0A150KAN4_HEYCO|nr:hypothetical protein HMPREF3213_00741 [Heyndrickxia coagulans]KYC63096.1 hypothetical protein B4100_0256 [Heyndrickxia coagulans]KYC66669.1 hypothetical protein B4099_0500 [Heyndrickxia coagulans]KYC85331.1 hypothetical protein B4096_0320 [Heyndrickxia coagulans]